MIFIVADDLTGASDSGIQLQKNGLVTFVVLDPDKIDEQKYAEYEAVAINTDTRAKSPEEASRMVAKATQKIKALFPDALLYKKIDSLFRGNSVPEIEALMSVANIKTAFVVPAFPEGNRTMMDGKIENMGKVIDVLDLFQAEAHKKTGLIPLEIIQQGASTIQRELDKLLRDNCAIILFDGQKQADLEAVYHVFEHAEKKALLCGSAGMASLIGKTPQQKKVFKEVKARAGISLYAIGSQNPITEKQVHQILEENKKLNVGVLDTGKIQANQEAEEIDRVFDRLRQNDLKHPTDEWLIVLDSLFAHAEFELKVTEEKDLIAKKIVKVLGELAVRINQYRPITKLVATGGDTALGICQSFHADGIVLQEEVLPGIPSGHVVGGELDGAVIITKSGGFGNSDALIAVSNYLVQKSEGGMENVN